MALAISNIKFRCVRNSDAFPSATKQASLSALDPEPYSLPCGEVPATQWLSRQEPAFLWQSTVARGEATMLSCYSIQESEILGPKLFFRRTKPSSSLPSTVLSPPSQAHLLSYPWLFPFFLHSNTSSTGGEEKSCGKENSSANPCDIQSPLWLLQSMQPSIPVKVYGTEIQVTACQLHCSSFLCAYHRSTLWKWDQSRKLNLSVRKEGATSYTGQGKKWILTIIAK